LVLDWEPTGALTLEDSVTFPRFIDTFAAAMHAASPQLELHVYAGWVHQPAVKNGEPWRAHWFNYSLDGNTAADFLEVGITYDHSPHQASNISGWEARLQCVLGEIDSWAGYPCEGRVPAAKLGAGLMSHFPEYDSAAFSARLDIVKKLGLGGPLNIWVNSVSDVWLPLLADYIQGK